MIKKVETMDQEKKRKEKRKKPIKKKDVNQANFINSLLDYYRNNDTHVC